MLTIKHYKEQVTWAIASPPLHLIIPSGLAGGACCRSCQSGNFIWQESERKSFVPWQPSHGKSSLPHPYTIILQNYHHRDQIDSDLPDFLQGPEDMIFLTGTGECGGTGAVIELILLMNGVSSAVSCMYLWFLIYFYIFLF